MINHTFFGKGRMQKTVCLVADHIGAGAVMQFSRSAQRHSQFP